MAQQTRILLTDDMDGSPAATTVRFDFDGASYEIDLSEAHAVQFARAMEPYLESARRVSRQRRPARAPSRTRHDQSAVRTWAREQGLKVSDRGRIPTDVLAKFEAEH
jgi:hypothetical protein